MLLTSDCCCFPALLRRDMVDARQEPLLGGAYVPIQARPYPDSDTRPCVVVTGATGFVGVRECGDGGLGNGLRSARTP
jgi:hypothetical protein